MSEGRKDDGGKLRWGLLRKSLVKPLEAVIRVLMWGANKYGDENWQLVENGAVRYRDALDRHLAQIDKGEFVDTETGEFHYAHVATNALFPVVVDADCLAVYLPGATASAAPEAVRSGAAESLPDAVGCPQLGERTMSKLPNLPSASDSNDPVRLCRIGVMAAMETGNPKRARTLLNELADTDKQSADNIRMDVVRAYGTHLPE